MDRHLFFPGGRLKGSQFYLQGGGGAVVFSRTNYLLNPNASRTELNARIHDH